MFSIGIYLKSKFWDETWALANQRLQWVLCMRNQRSSWTAPSIKFHLIFVARLYISGFGQIEEKKWCKVITCRSCSTYSHHKASSNTINNILLCESSLVKSSQIKSSRVWAESSLLPRRANICSIGMSICSMTWIFFFQNSWTLLPYLYLRHVAFWKWKLPASQSN